MMKSTSQLFKSIIITSPAAKQETIAKRIAELFNLKLINSKELEKKHNTCLSDLAPIIFKELDKNNCRSWLLDGFPRTRAEAEQLWKEQKCHIALNLKLPLNLLVAQANKERLIHPTSGRIYTSEFNPPLRTGRDDVTGDDLEHYDDFSTDELKQRFVELEDAVRPVLQFYRDNGVLQEIHGNSTADLINKSRICLSSVLPDAIL